MATPRHIVYTLTDDRLNGLNIIQKEAIGNEIISAIESRTARGIDKDGQPFEAYNKNYVESQHFKDAGKSRVVNLEFSSDMINSMVFLPALSGGNKVSVGFTNGSPENERAQFVIDGHGRKGDSTQPKRDFMGLTGSERSEILGSVTPSETQIQVSRLTSAFLDLIF